MNTEKLELINAIVNEGKAYKAHVDSMEAECKSIQQYCLDAVQDFHDTFCAVVELIESNPQLGQSNPNRYFGNYDSLKRTCFMYITDNPNGKYLHSVMKDGATLRGLMFLVKDFITENAIVKVKKIVANEPVSNIQKWSNWKIHADDMRLMSEALLESVRIAAEKYRNEQKELIDKGISAGAQTYKKVIK